MKSTMKPREGKGAPPADFHVCFPPRPQLTLTPKPLCSPARSNESSKRHHPHHNHNLTRRNNRGGQASPSLWANTKLNTSDGAEPTSPKVTCAGQIKVRAKKKKNSSKNWQSVMEEIEKVHSKRSVHETVGFKKDMMRFFTSLRGFQCDLTCFHPITDSDANTSIEEEREVCIDDNSASGGSQAVFSKWYMVMQENKENEVGKDQVNREERDGVASNVPPSNALLLMRCNGTSAKSLVEEKEQEREEEAKRARLVLDQEEKNESLIFKGYAPDVADEKWIVGGLNDPFSRSRRWRRC